jgi:hypothetical protein
MVDNIYHVKRTSRAKLAKSIKVKFANKGIGIPDETLDNIIIQLEKICDGKGYKRVIRDEITAFLLHYYLGRDRLYRRKQEISSVMDL